MGGVQPGDLTRLALGFGRTSNGLGMRQIGSGLGPVSAPSRQIERVPPEAEASQQQGDSRHTHQDQGEPAEGCQTASERADVHGNTRRSSSKWGPSLKVGQSPPQTMATPRSCAAAFTARAIRG